MIEGHTATVAEMWRYPVKSMLGERIEVSDVADAGFTGDRAYAVIDPARARSAARSIPGCGVRCCSARPAISTRHAGAQLPPVAITAAQRRRDRK